MESKKKENIYVTIGENLGRLIDDKNKSYGDSFHKSGEVMKQLFPDGIPPESYVDALALVRIIDKMFRVARDPTYNGENCWSDICGYAMLRLADQIPDKESKKEKIESGLRPVDKAFFAKYFNDYEEEAPPPDYPLAQ